MSGIVRKGDTNNAGGATALGEENFVVNSKPACVKDTPVKPHGLHIGAKTTSGRPNFVVNGKPVTVVSDTDSCAHVRVSGSGDFIIGN
jgi:uncharacterized Zn-binding protein involved in type VI secretion